jgi:hypothetical protein
MVKDLAGWGNIGNCAKKKRVNREIFLFPLSNPNEGSPPQGRSAARRGRLPGCEQVIEAAAERPFLSEAGENRGASIPIRTSFVKIKKNTL